MALGCVCSSHVFGWRTSVEVVTAVPPAVSCLPSCWEILCICGPLERWGAGRLFHRGIRTQAAAQTRARLVFWGSGASGMGARMQLTENRHYLVSSKLARAPFPHENRVLTLKLALVGAIQNCVNHGQATLRARTTPHTDSPSHNGSSVQLDPALHLPDLTGLWPRSQSS